MTTDEIRPILRYFHTLKHLRGRQLFYQGYYRVRRFVDGCVRRDQALTVPAIGNVLQFAPFVTKHRSYDGGAFTFLNRTKSLGSEASGIDWEYGGYGKLWAYNLNYFDCLHQQGLDRNTGLELIQSFIVGVYAGGVGLEPYPISLRGLNWIKFLSVHQFRSPEIDASLYAQYLMLCRNIEFHLQGNHVLENAFSLLFGAFYFRESSWYHTSCKLLVAELDEQVLGDGAHFELSPMYHQILLDRLLDSVNLLQNNRCFAGQEALLMLVTGKAMAMVSWLQAICFADGTMPHLNDATDDIAPSSGELFAYADRLGISRGASVPGILHDCGYRKYVGSGYECIVDVGRIGPEYIPGHAHADSLAFVLKVDERPFLVDTGLSTYEKGTIRDQERGTPAHNTVVVNGENSSDVWGGFRVGNRARVLVTKEAKAEIIAEHDGYRRFGVLHRRRWKFEDRRFVVVDQVIGKHCHAEARFHFDRLLVPKVDGHCISVPGLQLVFAGAQRIELVLYRQALGFNRTENAWCAVVLFDRFLETVISLG